MKLRKNSNNYDNCRRCSMVMGMLLQHEHEDYYEQRGKFPVPEEQCKLDIAPLVRRFHETIQVSSSQAVQSEQPSQLSKSDIDRYCDSNKRSLVLAFLHLC